MNLLPKSHKEFGEKDYWNKFFNKRGNKAFEWYGEYLELCSHLHKYIKQTDFILVPGCGNSALSADLYDVGFTNITNIDVSEVVVKQMTRINANRTKMQFIHMDALQTIFPDLNFNVVLDKGTLDALMPDDAAETNARIDKYFGEIKRVLKLGGRFVCISLLQLHILDKLLAAFCDRSWMIRIVRCHEAEEKNAENGDGTTLPVFVVVLTKFKEMPQMILEVCLAGDKMVRLQTPEELKSCIKSVQDTAFITNGLAKTNLDEDDEVTLDLMQPGSDSPRYTVYVVDQNKPQTSNKYAVFVVPQGSIEVKQSYEDADVVIVNTAISKTSVFDSVISTAEDVDILILFTVYSIRESEWLFGTALGRRQLQQSARFSRLVVAALRRGHHFDSLDAVKEELAATAKMLAPPGFTGQIPFLSLGSDVGRRVKVHEGTSKLSGDFVIEDVDVDGATRRRLVFMDNQFLVQSEAALKTVKAKNRSKQVVDFGHISLYHSFMCAGAQGALGGEGGTVAVLGLGGGGLCMFMRKCFKAKIVAVDIDPSMLEIAKQHFDLKLDEHLKVQIKDGIDFLKEESEKGGSYAAVLFDMDNKDRSRGLSCPPQHFLEDDALTHVTRCLANDGHFILNLVCREKALHDSLVEKLKRHFKHLVSIQLYEEVNEVIFATNSEKAYTTDGLSKTVKDLNTAAREKNLAKIRCVDLQDFLQSVRIIS